MILKRLCISVFFIFFAHISAAFALPISVDMTRGIWTITGLDASGGNWTGSTLNFDTQVQNGNDWDLTGYFYWQTTNTSAFGRENFTGSLLQNGSLSLYGFAHQGPTSGIILANYFAELAPSKNNIVNGTWVSNTPYIPSNGWTAERPPAPSAVPLPAALPLYATALAFIGIGGWFRKRRNT
jgi:hypothetical protein